MRDIETQQPVLWEEPQTATGNVLSRRAYNMLLAVFLFASLVVMGLCARWVESGMFFQMLGAGATIFVLVCTICSFVSLFVMSSGRANQNVVTTSVGFALFALSFGFTLGAATSAYEISSVNMALLATAGITVVFGGLGMAFPAFFEAIHRTICVALFAVIIAEIVLMLFGVSPTWIDWLVVALFCGFIGYDFHMASSVEPTLVNALWFSAEIYLDIANVLIRLLSIFGRRRD